MVHVYVLLLAWPKKIEKEYPSIQEGYSFG